MDRHFDVDPNEIKEATHLTINQFAMASRIECNFCEVYEVNKTSGQFKFAGWAIDKTNSKTEHPRHIRVETKNSDSCLIVKPTSQCVSDPTEKYRLEVVKDAHQQFE